MPQRWAAVVTGVEAVESTHLVERVEGSHLVVLAVSAVETGVEAWAEKMVVATSVAAVAKVAGDLTWRKGAVPMSRPCQQYLHHSLSGSQLNWVDTNKRGHC